MKPVQTSVPEPELAARVEGTPAPAALESFADFLLERIQATAPPPRPTLELVTNHAENDDHDYDRSRV